MNCYLRWLKKTGEFCFATQLFTTVLKSKLSDMVPFPSDWKKWRISNNNQTAHLSWTELEIVKVGLYSSNILLPFTVENECVPTFLKIFTQRISNVSFISSANVCKIPVVRLRNTLLGSHLRSAHVFLFFFLYLSTSPTRENKYSSLCYLEFLLSCWCCWWGAPWITTFFFLLQTPV